MSATDRPEPLRPVEFEILLSLAGGPCHGYAIIDDAERRNPGLRLETATLYRALRRLVEGGLVRPADPPPGEASTDERRRFYAITPHGTAAARQEAARLERLVAGARAARLLPRPGRSAS